MSEFTFLSPDCLDSSERSVGVIPAGPDWIERL